MGTVRESAIKAMDVLDLGDQRANMCWIWKKTLGTWTILENLGPLGLKDDWLSPSLNAPKVRPRKFLGIGQSKQSPST